MNRYDRLSSSKSDLAICSSSAIESSVDECDIQNSTQKIFQLESVTHQNSSSFPSFPNTNSSPFTSTIQILNTTTNANITSSKRPSQLPTTVSQGDITVFDSPRKSMLLESYSSTENIIPSPVSSSDLTNICFNESISTSGTNSISSGSSSATSLQLPSTTTLKSFIKTRTAPGISIISRSKDTHHHHHHHHHKTSGDDEDEEVIQLCDETESAHISKTPKLLCNGNGQGNVSHSCSNGQGVTITVDRTDSFQSNSSNSVQSTATTTTTTTQFSIDNPCHGTGNIEEEVEKEKHRKAIEEEKHKRKLEDDEKHRRLLEEEKHRRKIDHDDVVEEEVEDDDDNDDVDDDDDDDDDSPEDVNQLTITSYESFPMVSSDVYSSKTEIMKSLSGSCSNTKSGSHIHSRLPPMFKNNRFVKHSKTNLLFNMRSGFRSKSKQRLTEHIIKGGVDSHSHISHELSLESLKYDRAVPTLQPDEDRRRRTIIIEKNNGTFGFTLQTYGIQHRKQDQVELITYVDDVAYGGPAFRGGMRPGDVILSINGRDVEKADHCELVQMINACDKTMRLVVLFEDCVRKIDLNMRYIKLRNQMQQKMMQLEILNQREKQILLNAHLRAHNAHVRTHNVSSVFTNTEDKENRPVSANSNTVAENRRHRCKSLDIISDEAKDTAESPCSDPWSMDNFGNEVFDSDSQNKNQNTGQHSTIIHISGSDNLNHDIKQEEDTSRSQSLQQSTVNSIDCLTNPAYEDHENLIELHDSKTQNPSSNLLWIDDKNHSYFDDSFTRNHFKNRSISSEKDFITKL